jgi:hypothetical protein
MIKRRGIEMRKRLWAVLLCVLLLVSFAPNVLGAEIPQTLEAPLHLTARYDTSWGPVFRWTEPEGITKLYAPGPDQIPATVLAQMDVKIDDGPWRSESESLSPRKDRLGPPFAWDVGSYRHDVNNVLIGLFIVQSNFDTNFSLANKTYHFRVRHLVEYEKDGMYHYVIGPFSEIASFGKDAPTLLPKTLEAPPKPKAELLKDGNGAPYFSLNWDIPESITKANQQVGISAFVDWKIGDGRWASESGLMVHSTGSQLDSKLTVYPKDTGGFGEVNIEANLYSFRVYFKYDAENKTVVSPFSIPVIIGTPAYTYKGASSWAVPELNKASEYGLITDRIMGNMAGPITREEFCEVVVRLYEIVSGTKAAYTATDAFSDTTNPEIYKAYELGIVNGVGGGKFAPEMLINREQIAAMMHRAAKAMKPAADFSTDGADKYPDEKSISGWALESVLFMSENGLMTNIKGNFEPKGTTTREQAVVIAVRTIDRYSE